MNTRQSEILKALYRADEYITLAEMAEQMQVSVKTVRNDIASIREYLSEQGVGEIETKPHAGIRLIMNEEEWRSLGGGDDIKETEMFFFIIRHLLKSKSLTAQRLAQQYYIGRSQLERTLEKVAQWFDENKILFERKRGKGISIEYCEFNYRMALLSLYCEYVPFFAELINAPKAKYAFLTEQEYTAMCAALGGFDPDRAALAISETEREFGLSVNYTSGVNMLFLTSLCILRSRNGYAVEMPKTVSCPADGESETKFAKSLIKKLEEIYKMSFSEEETEFIAFAAGMSEIQEFESEAERRRFEAMNIGLCKLTVKAVNLISEITGVDLREDKFFVRQLFIQLKVSIFRLKYGIVRKNQLLVQIKTKYPNMMAVAWFLGNVFEKELGLEINEHEVGFLALHIGGAIERQLSEVSACVVCDYGVGISQILKEKIVRAISGIKITSVLSGRDIQRINSEQCDFVIAAAPLEGRRLNKEVITVGQLLDESDIRRLSDYIRRVRTKKKNKVMGTAPNTGLFSSELVFPDCGCKDKKELLHMMCAKLEAQGYVTDGFEKSVTDREKSAPTDIGKGFAVPHGLGKYVNHSAVAFARLKEPIEWTQSGETADMVFLVAFDLDENEQVKEQIVSFYKSIVPFMEDDAECERLRGLSDTGEIIKIFELW